MLHFADNLKTIRKICGDSQTEFAKRFTNVTRAMQQSYESGKASPDVVYLNQLEEITGFPAKMLMSSQLTKDQRRKIEEIVHFVDIEEAKKIPIIIDREENAEDLMYQKAAIIELSNQIAKILSIQQGRPVEDCLREIKQNTSLILQNLKA